MFSIQGFLTCQSKLPMNYKHLSQVERYQIYTLMKAGHDQTQIDKLLDRHKSTISRVLSRNQGIKSYRPKQACATATKRFEKSRNAATIQPWVAEQALGGTLWKNLRCQKQKRKRYAGGRDRRGQIPHRSPLSDRPSHIEATKQVCHWECDTVIGANHYGAIVKMLEGKSGFGVIVKMAQKTSDLVSRAIVEGLQPFANRVKTLTYYNGK